MGGGGDPDRQERSEKESANNKDSRASTSAAPILEIATDVSTNSDTEESRRSLEGPTTAVREVRMTEKALCRCVCVALAFSCIFAGHARDAMAYKYRGFAVWDFGIPADDNMCCPTCTTVSMTKDLVDVGNTIFGSWGWDAQTRYNQAAGMELFYEDTWYRWGEDEVGMDCADVTILATHGTYECEGPGDIDYVEFVPGTPYPDYAQTCHVDNRYMMLGNTTSNIFIAFTCNSAQMCVWLNPQPDEEPQLDFHPFVFQASRFFVYNGFHGSAYAILSQKNALWNYLQNTRYEMVGYFWLYFMADSYGGHDICPVSIAYADSEEEVEDAWIYGGMEDHQNPGSGSTFGYLYISGCNPAEGEQMPGSSGYSHVYVETN